MCCSHALDTSITISYLRLYQSLIHRANQPLIHNAPQVEQCLVTLLGALLLLLGEVFNSVACVQLLHHLSAALSGRLLKPE